MLQLWRYTTAVSHQSMTLPTDRLTPVIRLCTNVCNVLASMCMSSMNRTSPTAFRFFVFADFSSHRAVN